MTNPSELTEAIERRRSLLHPDGSIRGKSDGGRFDPFDAADKTVELINLDSRIADAFTDPAEITRESLLAVGFAPQKDGEGLWIRRGGYHVTWHEGDFDIFSIWPIEPDGLVDGRHGSYIVPFPQFMCDVAYLLYRLGRTKETR